ncbi:acylphosphatase [Mesorhizobium sp. ANAO-SY3R2]|uniref:acylphosphatase n=1 Tax=Mesorhizobium sp. ANAO-SY3R2 TaxID=3166644 RepID=UPI00366ABD71
MTDISRTVLVRISGRVQGVGYRAWAQRAALRLGLCGWVRNERDGSVAALISGSDEAVASMLDAFWQGPRGADVRSVVPETVDQADAPVGFNITG